jgi:hypothetical protein
MTDDVRPFRSPWPFPDIYTHRYTFRFFSCLVPSGLSFLLFFFPPFFGLFYHVLLERPLFCDLQLF